MEWCKHENEEKIKEKLEGIQVQSRKSKERTQERESERRNSPGCERELESGMDKRG